MILFFSLDYLSQEQPFSIPMVLGREIGQRNQQLSKLMRQTKFINSSQCMINLHRRQMAENERNAILLFLEDKPFLVKNH